MFFNLRLEGTLLHPEIMMWRKIMPHAVKNSYSPKSVLIASCQKSLNNFSKSPNSLCKQDPKTELFLKSTLKSFLFLYKYCCFCESPPIIKYSPFHNIHSVKYTAQKTKFSIKDLFSKCDKILRKMWIWSRLLKKSLMENFTFCAVICHNTHQRKPLFTQCFFGANTKNHVQITI